MVAEEQRDPTAPVGFGAVAAEEPEFATDDSKDYWDLVFEQLRRRKLFKIGVVVLTLLYGTAVFAPFLANDRPLVIESVDVDGYASALRILRPTASQALRAAQQTDAEYEAGLDDAKREVAPTRLAAASVELDAARMRVETIRSMLDPESVGPLDEYEAAFERGVEALRSEDDAAAVDALGAAKSMGRALRKDLAPLDVDEPEGGGVALIARSESPLLDSIAWWEVFLMALWLLWTLWPLWNPIVNRVVLARNRDRIRRARLTKLATCLVIGAACAGAWRLALGPVADFDVSKHKQGLTDRSVLPLSAGRTTAELAAAGELGDEALAGRVVWAPIRFGYAELHEDEKFRPPTWHSRAERDPETGRPVHLLESPEVAGSVAAQSIPVEVRAGEPALNDPWRHPLGTDESGRDVLARLIWGGRVSLSVGILSAALLTLIGVVIGSLAGYFGGWVDIVIMRGIEILQSIPAFFLILLALAFTDPNVVPPMFAIVLVIAVVRWTGVARLVRGEFLRLREQEFVIASQALGLSSWRTIFRHVLPNAMSPVLVAAAFSVAAGILTESAVSFLGFGIREPEASWGAIVNESRNSENWWIQLFPGIAIFVTVTCYNLVGDAIRDAMDPRMKV
ncbi:MAG: ABC transporter permease [Planctomycetota bacterium]